MPEISRFYGIVIKMFLKPKEHEPSHIHALYGEYVGEFNIQTFEMMEGDLPPKAQALVREWLASIRSSCKQCGTPKLSRSFLLWSKDDTSN